jgi:tripartite-type tricarboxylate transporter receptor subunit TctC
MARRISTMLAIAVLGVVGFVSTAPAQSVAEFYKGKTVSMIVGGSPGGGFDTLARAIARHITKHIPGNPNVVPRNMPGAGGLLAMDHLYNVAEKDGSVIALVGNTPPFVPLVTGKAARFDPLKMSWLGTPSTEAPLVLVMSSVPVHSVEDLKTRETAMARPARIRRRRFSGGSSMPRSAPR